MTRVAIDIGGTFTDVVGMRDDGRLEHAKTLTSYPDPSAGFFAGLEKLGAGFATYLGHGTTLSTNALLTRSGAKVALVTTAGFRDVLEIRRTHRKTLFDIYETIPEPLVPRDARFEVSERIAADGTVVTPLDEGELRSVAREIRRGGYGAAAVCFLFSFVNEAHERRAKAILSDEVPELSNRITLSCDTLPLHREYERTSTTVVSAMLMPLLRDYLSSLEQKVKDSGAAETLMIMQNTGGLVSARRAAALPVLTLLSGPAGGAAATAYMGGLWGETRLLALDMGGTSTDVSAVVDGAPETRLDFQVGEFDLSYPSIDIHTIGAGGGSQARVDAYGRLAVGPESSGSSPGPACYGLGGEIPTVTDANAVLGFLDPEDALGGEIEIDRAAAERAVRRFVAEPLGLSVQEAAVGIITIVNSNMMHALRFVSVERGRDPRDYTLVPFGGAGPIHGASLADALSIRRVLVPLIPGCNSAMGILAADQRHETVRAVHRRLADLDPDSLMSFFEEPAQEVREQLLADGLEPDRIRVEATADLRYHGQAYELAIPVPLNAGRGMGGELARRFQAEHRARYGHGLDDARIEMVNARLTGVGMTDKPRLEQSAGGSPADAYLGERKMFLETAGEFVAVPVFRRESLGAGVDLPSPALIVQSDATTFVPPGARARVDRFGCIELELG